MGTKRKNISFSDLLKHPASASLSHSKRALSLTFGFYLGLFPVLGCTTVLGLAASLTFRLNTFLVMGMNILLAPFQLLLMFPLIKYGQLLFFNNSRPYSEITFQSFFRTNSWNTFYSLLEYVAGGIMLWSFLCLISGFFIYRLFLKYSILAVKN